MKDLQREILNQVATGSITAEEGAARLEALEAPVAAPSPPAAAPSPAPASTGIDKVRVIARFGNTEILADPTVATAVADGPHRARQDGDTMVIEQTTIGEEASFEFTRPGAAIYGFDVTRKLVVRVNPNLPLSASVQAGNLRIEGLRARLDAEVQAGNLKIDGFQAPLNLVVMAGNVNATGRLVSGDSAVRCEMGQVRVNLTRDSSVRIKARTTIGKISVDGESIRSGTKEVTIGSGAGTLDLECTMGNVKVSVE